MALNFLKILFKMISPAIITSRVSRTGFLKPLEFIPASMLKGAIISQLYRNGAIDASSLTVASSSIFASYAYPVVGNLELYPCHPLMYECKICKEFIDYTNIVIDEMERSGVLELRNIVCNNGHRTLENLYTKFYPKYDIISHKTICVGIDKERGSSEVGMLYEYEAIPSESKFWAILAISEEYDLKDFEFYIGRGISRGFGKARIVGIK
ncbi:MAG: hypothetical protein N3D72_02885, partial [Candidatus Methanomethyliaceae archaeon]|nr:hypothetical protein [Candidatus Methanomethyliaceae archaeon]